MNTLLKLFTVFVVLNSVNCVKLNPTEKLVVYDLQKELTLACAIEDNEEGLQVKWFRDDKPIGDLIKKENLEEVINATAAVLKIKDSSTKEAGKYTCVVKKAAENETVIGEIEVSSKIYVKTPKSVNVIEGEKLKIICDIKGSPVPVISWEIINETYTESRDRVKLSTDDSTKVPNTILIVEDITPDDKGVYTCMGTRNETGESVKHETIVRVKDKYAALWPFLGICAEVFVLCAIILVYEKKRNKNDLEESDTDQSPEQKNIPDQGKDSNLRHRQ